ncbi:fibronectin type III domain-containing protein [Streptomyces sp. KMM 9044]|uniref:fibronectin type III domain-containing protein n=1 Tax=Streptomyces sp. KMM 9044 TaxID=2744474 RepID=UPI0021514B16|nr:fibronectin type III domain-containing protein [Streptomyces sp. KMM 9044]WAX76422.1 fibronectin type III domain-containing protein [Streptomyces sp. KMM 9044]
MRTHSAVLDGLSHGTEYEYRVGTGDRFGPAHRFTTARPAREEEAGLRALSGRREQRERG